MIRPLVALGALAGLAASFTAGAVIAGGDDGTGGRPDARGSGDTLPVAFADGELSLPESCQELLDWYVDRGVDRVGPWGWNMPYIHGDVLFSAVDGAEQDMAMASGVPEAAAPLPATSRVTNGGTGTNVQEVGVDEPDVVKTDGRTLFRVQDGDLVTYDLSGDEVDRLGSVDLDESEDAEILLAGDTIVVISHTARHGWHAGRDEPGLPAAETTVLVLDVTDPAAPELEHSYLYDTGLVTARLHGDAVRLVLQSGLPDLDFVTPDQRRGLPDITDREALRENQRIVRESTIEDWLPTVSVDGSEPEQLVPCEDVALPSDGDSLGTIAVVGFDAANPQERSVSGLAVETDLAYASADKLYLATAPSFSPGWVDCFDCPMSFVGDMPRWVPGVDDGTSHIYAFDLDGLDTTYTASGEVDGFIRDRWAMDEHDGVLRLAVGPTRQTGNFNSVLTLRQVGTDLVEVGRVDKLGVNEQIQSVRWFDSLAIVVTFRQVDPLYAIDLTDAENPTLMGELKIPGFSAYLHPLGGQRLIGLGEGPAERRGWGAQAGLFDVTDLTAPKQIDVVSYGSNTRANAADDPRQLTWLPDRRVVLTVVTDWGLSGGMTGYVSVLQLGDGQLANEMVEVEHGQDVHAVRLVPLPDGRVVLVTGEDAEFFDV